MLELIIRDLMRMFHGFDDGAFRIVLATFIANRIEQRPREDEYILEPVDPLDPVWMLLVGPPSSGKTESMNLISGHRDTYDIVELTTKTMASGHNQADHLLNSLTNKVVLIKDLSGIFSKRDFEVGAILDQFRQIYDGRVSFAWGSGKATFNWSGKMGLIAGCTEDIYERHKVVNEMGDRFLYYPVRFFTDSTNRRAVSRAARRNARRDGTLRREMKERVHLLVDMITEEPVYEDSIHVPEEIGNRIDDISDLSTRMRGYVPRDYRHNITAPPQLEGPGRMAKVLELLAIAMAVLHQVPEPTPAHLSLIRKAAFGGCKPVRREIVVNLVRAMTRGQQAPILAEIVREIGKPRTTVERAAEDLEALGLLRSFRRGNARAYEIQPEMREGLLRILGVDRHGRPVEDQSFPAHLQQVDAELGVDTMDPEEDFVLDTSILDETGDEDEGNGEGIAGPLGDAGDGGGISGADPGPDTPPFDPGTSPGTV